MGPLYSVHCPDPVLVNNLYDVVRRVDDQPLLDLVNTLSARVEQQRSSSYTVGRQGSSNGGSERKKCPTW